MAASQRDNDVRRCESLLAGTNHGKWNLRCIATSWCMPIEIKNPVFIQRLTGKLTCFIRAVG